MGLLDEFFGDLDGLEWDAGNSEKNWHPHAVRQAEAEQALLNRPVLLALDVKHAAEEARFFGLGRTDAGRPLVVVFTARGTKVRVIMARPMNLAERRIYAQTQANAETDSDVRE